MSLKTETKDKKEKKTSKKNAQRRRGGMTWEARRTFQNSQKPGILYGSLRLIWATPAHLLQAFLASYTDLL